MYKKREVYDYIDDILIAISDIETFTKEMSYDTFTQERLQELKPLLEKLRNTHGN